MHIWSNSIKQRNKSAEEKFWEKVNIKSPQECWEWLASKNRKGYGNFYLSVGHSKDKHCLAHRMAWQLNFGEIPEGMQVLHKCDNPSCVNPNHLFLGTNIDNVLDRVKKGREADRRGEKHPGHKLTERDVLEIRRLRSEEHLTLQAIANKFNINYSTVGYIMNRRLWSHI